METAIFWFRRDLRLTDNANLRRALAEAGRLVPVYVHAPEDEAPWAPGRAARWWLHRSLAALDGELRACGSRLILMRGPARELLPALARQLGAGAVFWGGLLDPALRERDARVAAALAQAGVAAVPGDSGLLYDPAAVSGATGRPFRVFTAFWNACRRLGAPATPLPAPHHLKPPAHWPAGEPLAALGLLSDGGEGFEAHWTPGEQGALARLRRFLLHGLERYAVRRDLPGEDGVSRLSPHLHAGEISPRQIWAAVVAERPEDGEAFLRQLGWREFAHHLLYHYPASTDAPLDERFRQFPWREDPDGRLLECWRTGRTGYPLVDAGMRELQHMGWMHNRARMVAASFLVKNLRQPWQQGARWFWQSLVDADLANNTLGWQWVTGSGADAAPYFRVFNPVRQAQRFDAEGRYVRRWLPELAHLPRPWLFEPWRLSPALQREYRFRPGEDYPMPVVELAGSRAEALAAFRALRAAR